MSNPSISLNPASSDELTTSIITAVSGPVKDTVELNWTIQEFKMVLKSARRVKSFGNSRLNFEVKESRKVNSSSSNSEICSFAACYMLIIINSKYFKAFCTCSMESLIPNWNFIGNLSTLTIQLTTMALKMTGWDLD